MLPIVTTMGKHSRIKRTRVMHVEHNFDVSQKLEKFKQRVGERRKAALTIKTASGIASFEESK